MTELRLGIDASGARVGADEWTRQIQRVKTGTKDGVGAVGTLTSSFDSLRNKIFNLQSLMFSFGVGFTLNSVIDEFAAFEKGLIGVGKTADIEGQRLRGLGKQIQQIGLVTPTATNELLGIAQAAGQLGVKGEENIALFTKTVADLGGATDLAGEEAATSLARILNVTGEAISDVDRLGSSIVGLGNNFVATESEITGVATRVAQATAQFSTSAAEVVGFGAAMRSVGVQAESGGTVIGLAFQAINDAVRRGGEALDNFTAIMGTTSDELKTLFNENATNAVVEFIEGLGRLQASGGDVTQALEGVGLSGVRVVSVLGTLATRSEILREALNRSNKEWEKNTALQIEAEKAAQSLSARMQILKNSASLVAVTFVETFSEDIKDEIDSTAGALQTLAENINVVVDGIQVAAAALVSKLVAGLIASAAESVKAQVAALNTAKAYVTQTAAAERLAQAKLADVAATKAAIVAAREQAVASLASANATIMQSKAFLASAKNIQDMSLRMAGIREATKALSAAEATRTTSLTQLATLGKQQANITKEMAAATGVATAATAAHTKALQAASIAGKVTTATMNGLKAAMAFLGGPIGAALTALSVGFIVFGRNAADATMQVESLADKVDRLTGSVQSLRRAELSKVADEIKEQMESITDDIKKQQEAFSRSDTQPVLTGRINKLKELGDRYASLNEQLDKVKTSIAEIDKADAPDIPTVPTSSKNVILKNLEAETSQLKELKAALEAGGDAYKDIEAKIKALALAKEEDLTLSKDELAQISKQVKANDELEKAIQELYKTKYDPIKAKNNIENLKRENSQLEDLVDAYGKSEKAVEEVNKQIEVENALREVGLTLKDEEGKQLAELVKKNYELKDSVDELRDSQEKANSTADLTAEIYKDAARNINSAFTDTFRDILDDGIGSFRNLKDRILDIFKDMLAQMATLAIAKPVIVPIVQSLGGILGLGQADIAGVTGQLGGGIGGSGVGLSVPTPGVSSVAQLGGGFGGAFLGGGLGALYGYQQGGTRGAVIGGLAGYAGGAALTAGTAFAASGAGATAAGALGAGAAGATSALAAIPGWGWAALGALAIFGGGKKKPSDKVQGTTLNLGSLNITEHGFTGKKFSQENRDAADQLATSAKQLVSTLSQVTGGSFSGKLITNIGSRDGLRFNFAGEAERNFGFDFDKYQKAITEGIVDRLQGVPQALKNAIKRIDFSDAERALSDLQFATAFTKGTLFDNPESISAAKQALDNLKTTFDDLTATAKRLGFSTSSINAEYAKQVELLKSNFLKGIDEQILAITDPLTLALRRQDEVEKERLKNAKDFGVSLVDVERLNALERQKIVEQYNSDVISSLNTSFSNIRNFLINAPTSNVSALNAQDRFDIAEEQFATLFEKAAQKDATSLEMITQAAQTFLTEAKSFTGGAGEYSAIFADVNTKLESLLALDTSTQDPVIDQLKDNAVQASNDNAQLIDELRSLRAEVVRLNAMVDEQNDRITVLLAGA